MATLKVQRADGTWHFVTTKSDEVIDIENKLAEKADKVDISTGLIKYNDNKTLEEFKDEIEQFQSNIENFNNDITELTNVLIKKPDINANLSFGMNSKIVNNTISQIPEITFKGKNYVNLLGKDGKCDKIENWKLMVGGSMTIEQSIVLGGCIKISNKNGSVWEEAILNISGIDKKKYYCVSGYLKNGNVINADGIHLGLSKSDGSMVKQIGVINASNFERVSIKYEPTDLIDIVNIGVAINSSDGTSKYAYFSNIMINEITEAEYNDKNYQPPPYVDNYGVLTNPYIEIRHDNIANKYFTTSRMNVAGVFTRTELDFSKDEVQFYCGGKLNYVDLITYLPIKPNTTYSFSFNAKIINGTGGSFQVRMYDAFGKVINGSISSGIFNSMDYALKTGKFTTSNDAVAITLRLFAEDMLTFNVKEFMLVEGDTPPIEYKPCKIERCVIEGQFADGDYVTLKNGNVEGLINWNHKTLFGKDYDWGFSVDFVGYKTIYVNYFATGLNFPTSYCIDHNCGIVPFGDVGSINNAHVINNGTLYMSIPDGVSGWSETSNPNNDEVKAFMNGWKAVGSVGSRYVAWVSVLDGKAPSFVSAKSSNGNNASGQNKLNLVNVTGLAIGNYICIKLDNGNFQVASITAINGSQLTLNSNLLSSCAVGNGVFLCDNGTNNTDLLNHCKNNIAPNYEGYKIHYKLANSEIISQKNIGVIGDILKLNTGNNYVYLDSGIVLGEVANVGSSGGYRYINATHVPSQLKYKVETINDIYKNGILNTLIWNNTANEAYGKVRVSTQDANFDNTSIYTVDYKVLSTDAPNIGNVELQYVDDLVSALETTVDSLPHINEKANNIDYNRLTNDKSVTGAINELSVNKVNNTDLDPKTTGGTASAYTITVNNPNLNQYTIVPHITNAVNATISINGGTAIALKGRDGNNIQAGALVANIPVTIVRVGSSFFIASGGGGSNIKSMQTGTAMFEALTAEMNLTINDIDLNKSVVRIGYYGSVANLGSFFTASLYEQGGLKKLKLRRTNSNTGDEYVFWKVIEYNNVKSVQRGAFLYGAGSTERNITINPVNMSKSELIFTYNQQGYDQPLSARRAIAGYISASNQIKFLTYLGFADGDANISYEVIEFN